MAPERSSEFEQQEMSGSLLSAPRPIGGEHAKRRLQRINGQKRLSLRLKLHRMKREDGECVLESLPHRSLSPAVTR